MRVDCSPKEKGSLAELRQRATLTANLLKRQPNYPYWICGFAPLHSCRFALFALNLGDSITNWRFCQSGHACSY